MQINIHTHAAKRAVERGASESEVIDTVKSGESFPAKFGRIGFRKNFLYNGKWNNKYYPTKQIEAYCVRENKNWLVITVIIKFF